MLEILLITLKEVLLQAWSSHLDTIEIDLARELIGELQAGPEHCRSYLRGLVTDVRKLLERPWTLSLNYGQRSVNMVASVLALIKKDQRDILAIHAEPPDSLQPALELDVQTYKLAKQLQEEADSPTSYPTV